MKKSYELVNVIKPLVDEVEQTELRWTYGI